MTLRGQLVLLVFATLVPVLAFTGFAAMQVVRHEFDSTKRSAQDRARAVMTAIDARAQGHVTALEVLASSSLLTRGNLRAFHADAADALASQPDWASLRLAAPSGEVLFDAAKPFGTRSPSIEDEAALGRALTQQKASFGAVVRSAAREEPVLSIDLPVVRRGKVPYVLSLLVKPESFRAPIEAQRSPQGSVSGLTDADGRFIARIPPRPMGSLSGEGFRKAVSQAPEGWYRSVSIEKVHNYTAHVTSSLTGWHLGLAIPTSIIDQPMERAATAMGAGALLSILVALGVAFWLGRRIAAPIEDG
ncbi:MAG: cache domain-containing protein [Betaproteobacteria bacterium]|nr:cache domain-containing protein [Betaproteobacteria bacterium]